MTPSPFHGIFGSLSEETSVQDAEDSLMPNFTPQNVMPTVATGSSAASSAGQIAVDIYEVDNYIIIRAPIAGVKLSDLDIEVDDRIVTISGKRPMSDEVSGSQYYVQECFWGEFSRSITLPFPVDAKKIKATFSKSSILKVIIPRESEEKVSIVRVNEG